MKDIELLPPEEPRIKKRSTQWWTSPLVVRSHDLDGHNLEIASALPPRVLHGERDSNIIDVDDFRVGTVLEDQGLLTDMLSRLRREPVAFVHSTESQVPFFPPKTAQDLLSSLEKLLPPPKPVVALFVGVAKRRFLLRF